MSARIEAAASTVAPVADVTRNGPSSVWVRFNRYSDCTETWAAFKAAGWAVSQPSTHGSFSAARTESGLAKAGASFAAECRPAASVVSR